MVRNAVRRRYLRLSAIALVEPPGLPALKFVPPLYGNLTFKCTIMGVELIWAPKPGKLSLIGGLPVIRIMRIL
jgi:hypothetical protein